MQYCPCVHGDWHSSIRLESLVVIAASILSVGNVRVGVSVVVRGDCRFSCGEEGAERRKGLSEHAWLREVNHMLDMCGGDAFSIRCT